MAILKERVGLTRDDLRKLRAMRPGMSMDLQVVSPTGMKRVRTEFIGMDGIRCLILKFPDEGRWGNLRDAIYADNNLVIRYILEEEAGEVIAFKVKVNLVLSKPGNYIFTSFPLSIQCHSLRSEQRAHAHVPVGINRLTNETLVSDGMIVDLSLSGCRIAFEREQIREKIELKEQINLAIRNPDGQISNLIGTVMNQKSDGVKLFLGIKFDATENVVSDLLHQLMIS